MYIKRNYSFWMTFNWSKRPFLIGVLYATCICVISYFLPNHIILPWQPISIIGIAVAFYLGFKNNVSYDRTWEARKIWGSIVNNRRSFGAATVSFVQGLENDSIKKELIYRHIAWLTALRHQLRLSQPWEHVNERLTGKYMPTICEDYNQKLEKELGKYITESEIAVVLAKKNTATQILKNQSKRLQALLNNDLYDDFRHMEFQHFITSFYEDQGKSERIKNFPFPRQYASTALWLTFVFCAAVPFGLNDVFMQSEGWMYWLCPLFSGIIIWIYFLMEKIGDYSENPFEGSYNDVPITTIAKGIEIDMREMIDDTDIPSVPPSENGFVM